MYLTRFTYDIIKNRDMCFDTKNGKKTYFSGEIPVNDWRNVWRGLKSIRLIIKKIRISKVSCKESSRSESLKLWIIFSLSAPKVNELILEFVERSNMFHNLSWNDKLFGILEMKSDDWQMKNQLLLIEIEIYLHE